MIAWPGKDPGEVLDFTWNVPLDEGDTVASYTASIADGTVVIDSDSNTNTSVTAWISGGVDGEKAMVSLSAVTAGGRTFRETAVLPVFERASAVLADFRLRYPEFASVYDGTISYWLLDAGNVTSGWCESFQEEARLVLAAHNVALSGAASSGDATGALAAKGVTSFKSASMSVSFDSATIARLAGGGYGSTKYGLEFLRFRRVQGSGPFLAGACPC